MKIDLKSLGVKVAKYRAQLEESVEEVSTATGIEQSRLTAIENGSQEPTGDEVLIIADHFRCDFKFFLSNESLAPFQQTTTLYRARGRDFTKNDRRALQDFLYLCETEAFLMEKLGRSRKNFSFTPEGDKVKKHGADAAVALRSLLGYPDHAVPIDIYDDFRSIGIHVFRRKLGNSKISGLFIMHPVAGKCALININEDIYRQRFSAAHEAAHAIFDSDQLASVSFVRVDDNDQLEVRANRFASCYLMPPAYLARLPDPKHWDDDVFVKWANKLRVSCEALAYALKSARLIDWGKCKHFRSLRVPHELKVDPEVPASLSATQRQRKEHFLNLGLSEFYVSLCFEALKQGKISVGRLAEALLSTEVEAAEIAMLYGSALHVD